MSRPAVGRSRRRGGGFRRADRASAPHACGCGPAYHSPTPCPVAAGTRGSARTFCLGSEGANMSLQAYHAKRKFGATPEPRGRAARRKGNAFVIQKHDATRLHYDFRLELDGVMKSWAVTRGP